MRTSAAADGPLFSGSGRAIARRHLGPRLPQLAGLGALLLAATVLAVLAPQVLGRFVDAASGARPVGALLGIAGLYLLVALGAELFWVSADRLGAGVAWSATNDLRAELTEHCLGLDMDFYETRSGGELVDRVDGDVGVLANFFSQLFLLVVFNGLLLLGIGVALTVQDWRIGLVYLPFVLVSVLLLRRLIGVAVPAVVAQRQAGAILQGYLQERLGGLEDVSANGAAPNVRVGFWMLASGLLSAARRAARLGVRWPATAQALTSVGLILALVASTLLVGSGDLTLGSAYTLVAYAGMLQAPLMVIVTQLRDLEGAAAALRRVHELFGERSAVVSGPAELPPRGPGRGIPVAADRVSYRYPAAGDPGTGGPTAGFALRDVSFTLPAGRTLGVVGRSGSGKSTLARLLFRFADPQAGAIRLAGRDARELRLDALRGAVGLVTQEVEIFDATVRDNVTLFDPAVPADAVVAALSAARLGEWLAGLPDGLETRLGAAGTGMSAGEEQLLAFARVLLVDPSLVVLDEAASRLDPASRELFDAALAGLLDGRTAVIVAHELAALRMVDDVLVLQDGRVVEYGERTVLAADDASAFAAMLRAGQVPA